MRLTIHFRGPKPSPSGEAKVEGSRVMRRPRRDSHALRLQCSSRLGPEAPLRGRLRHYHEREGQAVEDDGRFQIDPSRTPRLTGEGRSVLCSTDYMYKHL